MNWDGQNPAREHGEWLIACIEDAAQLKESKASVHDSRAPRLH